MNNLNLFNPNGVVELHEKIMGVRQKYPKKVQSPSWLCPHRIKEMGLDTMDLWFFLYTPLFSAPP